MELDSVAFYKPPKIGGKPPTNILDDVKTNAKAYSVSNSRSTSVCHNIWHAQQAHTCKYRHEGYKSNEKNRIDQSSVVLGITVIRSVSELFIDAVDYRKYALINKSHWYDYEVENELNKMTKTTAVQMESQTFPGNGPMSIIVFSQDFNGAFVACNIHKCAGMWLLKHYLNSSVESVIKA